MFSYSIDVFAEIHSREREREMEAIHRAALARQPRVQRAAPWTALERTLTRIIRQFGRWTHLAGGRAS